MAIESELKSDTFPQKIRTDPDAFFKTAHETFKKAVRSAEALSEHFYLIGNNTVRLLFAGHEIAQRITPALGHLAADPSPSPLLTVCLWDDISTNTRMPPPPWAGYGHYNADGTLQSVYTRRGDVLGYNNDTIYTAFNWSADVLTVFDKKQNLALYWTRDVRHLPSYELSAPLRAILHWFMNQQGLQFIHSAAVGNPDGGVLLAGKGGSGKSTAAVSCLSSDLFYVSDDYCLLAAEPEPFVYSVYSSAKVNADNMHRVQHLMPVLSNADRLDTEKAVFFLYPHFAQRLISGFPVRALLLPHISGKKDTEVAPAAPEEGLKALALSTMSQLAGAGNTSLQIMHRLVKQVPCYHLNLGTDLSQIPGVISKVTEKPVHTTQSNQHTTCYMSPTGKRKGNP